MKKLDNKGFTLVELLATIVILGLLSTVTIITVTTYYEKSKEKSEEVFIEQLKGYVEDYIALYGNTLKYEEYDPTEVYIRIPEVSNSTGERIESVPFETPMSKCYKENNSENCSESKKLEKTVSLDEEQFNNIISFSNKSLKNPTSEVECKLDNTNITIYRDDDYLYCFTITPVVGDEICISDTISTCENIYKYQYEQDGNIEWYYVTFK